MISVLGMMKFCMGTWANMTIINPLLVIFCLGYIMTVIMGIMAYSMLAIRLLGIEKAIGQANRMLRAQHGPLVGNRKQKK